MPTFADRLKKARGRKGYTQQEVADLMEVHRFTYAKWEQGLHPPSKRSVYDKLAHHLDCSVAWLRDSAGEMGRYIPEPDHIRRRTPRRRPGGAAVHDPTVGSGVVDWKQVLECLSLLQHAAPPGTNVQDLAPALGLFYTLVEHQPANCSAAVAAQILQATGRAGCQKGAVDYA